MIELVIDMFPRCPGVDLDMMHLKIDILKDLRERGYELACDHDSFICAEIEVDEEGLESEIRTMMDLVSRVSERRTRVG